MLILAAMLIVSSLGQSARTTNQNGIFQALKQTEGTFNLGNWDGSQILSQKGDVLTTVSIKNGRLDFSRSAGQTRNDLLKSLYKAGLRRVQISVEHFLVVGPEGHIGPTTPQNGLFQTLRDADDGFNLNTFEDSSILDSNGKVLVSLTSRDRKVTLPLGPGQSLETLYERGLRSFFTKAGHAVKLVRGDQGKVVLKEEDSPRQ
jgi:hypothetical protein